MRSVGYSATPMVRDAAAMFGIVFAGALGAAVGVAAYLLLRSENKGRARSFRLAGRFYLPSPRSRRWRLWRILRR